MAIKKEKKTDLAKIAKKAKAGNIANEKKEAKNAKSLKDNIPPLEEHGVEPVVRTQNKGNKPKGATKHGTKKSTKKSAGKTDSGTIKKIEKKTDPGKETPLEIPHRRRGFFDWFTDGGKGGGDRQP